MSGLAPFGRDDQPQLEVKIIGGKQVEVAVGKHGVELQQIHSTGKHSDQSHSPLGSLAKANETSTPPWATRGDTPVRKILQHPDSSESGRRSGSVDRISTQLRHQGSSKGSRQILPPISTKRECDTRRIDSDGGNDIDLVEEINQSLTGFDLAKLKNVYLTFAGFDSTLTGFVDAEQIQNVFMKYQIPITRNQLQLLIDKFMSGRRPNWVNYEELLKFISSSMKSKVSREFQIPKLELKNIPGDKTTEYLKKTSPRNQEIALKPNQVSPRMDSDGQVIGRKSAVAVKKAFQDRQDAQLLLQVEQMFKGADNADEQIASLRKTFEDADHLGVEYMNSHKLKSICLRHRLPFNSSLLDKIVNRLDSRNSGKVSWKEFLEFVHRALPLSRTSSLSSTTSEPHTVETPPSQPVWETRQPLQPLKKRRQLVVEDAVADQEKEFDREQKILDAKLDKHNQERDQLLLRQQKHRHQQTKALQRDHLLDIEAMTRDPGAEEHLESEINPRQDEERKLLEQQHEELLRKQQELIKQKKKIQHEQEELEKYINMQREKLYGREGEGGDFLPSAEKESKIERFTRLAKALFIFDQDNSGFIDADSALRLIKNYNLVFRLNLTAEMMTGAVNASTTSEGLVSIEHVVDELHRHI